MWHVNATITTIMVADEAVIGIVMIDALEADIVMIIEELVVTEEIRKL